MITQRQAEATLAAVREQFRGYVLDGDVGPTLRYDQEEKVWEIAWEDGAPYEWTYRAFVGGWDAELASLAAEFGASPSSIAQQAPHPHPAGVWTEVVNSCVLAIYEAS